MFSQKDVEKIKTWLIENIVKEVARETSKRAKKREQELLLPQKSGSRYSNFYYISGNRANIRIKAHRGVIRGNEVLDIKSTMRRHPKSGKRHSVKAHERTYRGKKLFRKSDGKVLVLDHVPDSMAVNIIKESFYEALANRAEFFEGTKQRA